MTITTPALPLRTRIAALLCGLAVAAATIAACAAKLPADPKTTFDGRLYYAIAAGHIDQVPRPFANRFFEPLLARWISADGVSLETSFWPWAWSRWLRRF